MLLRNVTVQGGATGAWLVFFVPGLGLIAFGVAVVLMPQLLVALIAALCMLGGLGLASFGWRMRQMTRSRMTWQDPPAGPFAP